MIRTMYQQVGDPTLQKLKIPNEWSSYKYMN